MIKIKCKTCGKEFYKRKDRIFKNNFCSQKCFGLDRRTRKELKCAYCGKGITVIGCRIRKHNYCDNKCQLNYEYKHKTRERKPSNNLYKAHKVKCSGIRHYKWRGGKRISKCYLIMNKSKARIHRIIMEKHFGRKLKSSEVVHHINGNKLDNGLYNLVLMDRGIHTVLHNSEAH